MVPGAGIEPAQPYGRGILSPLRLPVPPPGRGALLSTTDCESVNVIFPESDQSMAKELTCPRCATVIKEYRNPFPTVDIIIRYKGSIVLVERKNEPYGWALPGGFVDYGESLESAARREAREETGLGLQNLRQFHAYSDPDRDPRQHNISVVFTADGTGDLMAGDDAAGVRLFRIDELPDPLCFDHGEILKDYRNRRF